MALFREGSFNNATGWQITYLQETVMFNVALTMQCIIDICTHGMEC